LLREPLVIDGPAAPPAPGVVIGIRPHDLEVCAPDAADVVARVAVVEALGPQALLHLQADGEPGMLRVAVPPETAAAPDDRVAVRLRRDRILLFDRATGRRLH
jgi:ABC-type sugar transport system ATPase subunit